ncbi:MAG: metallophosphoesterase [Lachnospiraceae bacterium]
MKPVIVTLLAAAAAGAAGIIRSEYEKDSLTVEETVITSDKIKTEQRIVFLSDLHDKEFGSANSRLLAAVRQQQPDLLLIGGDIMVAKEGRASLAVTEELISKLVKICPVYYGNGNHEQRLRQELQHYGDCYKQLSSMLEKYGVVYLSDASVDVGANLRISGLDIAAEYYRDFHPAQMDAAYINSHLGSASQERFQILMAHSPLFPGAYAEWGADLALAGHFHGGTIRLPGLGGLMTPQFQFFVPWCAGTFETNGRYLIVSRGLGTHSINIRFNNKPQVVVIRLLPA